MRVDIGISVVHSTLNTLISSSGGLLFGVSTVWSVENFLEPEKEVDSCCVGCVVHR